MKKILLLLIVVGIVATPASGREWAVVNTSSAFMRNAPDYSSELECQCLMGTLLELTGGQDRYWVEAVAPDGYKAWVTVGNIVRMTEERKNAFLSSERYICLSGMTPVRTSPNAGSDAFGELCMGDIVESAGTVRKGFSCIRLADGRTGWVKSSAVENFGAWSRSASVTGEKLVSTARKFLGVPYMWGGNTSKYFDCSGLVSFAAFLNGLILPRNASQQMTVGEAVPYDLSQMKPGDLVFFKGHVSIYVGEGRVIHSSFCVRESALSEMKGEVIAVRRITESSEGIGLLKDSPAYFVK